MTFHVWCLREISLSKMSEKLIILAFVLSTLGSSVLCQSSFFDLSAVDIDGNDVSFEAFRGKVVLVVNVDIDVVVETFPSVAGGVFRVVVGHHLAGGLGLNDGSLHGLQLFLRTRKNISNLNGGGQQMGSGGGASSGFLPEQAGFESQVENIILNGLVFQKCQKILSRLNGKMRFWMFFSKELFLANFCSKLKRPALQLTPSRADS